MDREDLKYIKGDTNATRLKNVEQVYLMFVNFLECYLMSASIKGFTHKYTKDTVIAFKEFYSIIRKEDSIFTGLVNNYKNIDLDEANDILNSLDLLNDKTYEYYESVFACIEDALTTGDDYRAKRYPKEFKTLIETDEFEKRLNKKTNVS